MGGCLILYFIFIFRDFARFLPFYSWLEKCLACTRSTIGVCHMGRETPVEVRPVAHGALQNWCKLGEKMLGLGDSCWWNGAGAWSEVDRVRGQPSGLSGKRLPCFLSCESEITSCRQSKWTNAWGWAEDNAGRTVVAQSILSTKIHRPKWRRECSQQCHHTKDWRQYGK